MSIEGKGLDSITKADLDALITGEVFEKKTLDYKERLPGDSEKDSKEFLFDVSSFANAAGGHLVFGMTENNGQAKELIGLPSIDPDIEIRRLESKALSGVKPRIPGVHTRAVAIGDSKYAIVMRIPKSWVGPHLVPNNDWYRCYSRTSNGKYPLDVAELKSAFVGFETAGEKINGFYLDRLNKIISGQTPIPFSGRSKLVLHIIPLSLVDTTRRFDVSSLATHQELLQPLNSRGWSTRHNFDGVMSHSQIGVEFSSYLSPSHKPLSGWMAEE